MITPLLEKALLMGWAEFRVHVHAYTAVSKIIIPENHFAVITDLIINPFIDLKNSGDEGATVAEMDKRSQYQIDFFSGSSIRNTYLFRNGIDQKLSSIDKDKPGPLYNVNSEPLKIDTFLIHKQNIYVSLACCYGVAENNGSNYLGLFPSSNPPSEPFPSEGYGTLPLGFLPVLLYVKDITSYTYVPTSREEAIFPPSFDDFQPRTKVEDNSKLGQRVVETIKLNIYTPLININYLLINSDGYSKLTGDC